MMKATRKASSRTASSFSATGHEDQPNWTSGDASVAGDLLEMQETYGNAAAVASLGRMQGASAGTPAELGSGCSPMSQGRLGAQVSNDGFDLEYGDLISGFSIDGLVDAAQSETPWMDSDTKAGIADALLDLGGGVADQVSDDWARLGDVVGTAAEPGQTTAPELGDAQLYAHGGYMGAASAFCADTEWAGIYMALMAKDAKNLASEVPETASHEGEAMSLLENNPILAAYGQIASQDAQREGEVEARDIPLEWDVWLDPQDPTDPDAAYITHGDTGDTASIGFFEGVDEMPKDITSTGMTVTRWLRLYGAALFLHEHRDQLQPWDMESVKDEPLLKQAVDGLAGVTGAGGVVLDIKSTWSTADQVAAFVAMLESMEIAVKGVGSFRAGQLADLDQGMAIRFFHGLDHLEAHRDTLAPGDQCLINLASLLMATADGGYRIDDGDIARLADLIAATGILVGGYAQESDLSAAAHSTLVDLVTGEHTGLFPLGYSYGNIDGQVSTSPTGSGYGSQESLDNDSDLSRDTTAKIVTAGTGGSVAVPGAGEAGFTYVDERGGQVTRVGLARAILELLGQIQVGASAEEVAARAMRRGVLDTQSSVADLRLGDTVTRAEAATMIVRCFRLGLDLPEGQIAYFADLGPGDWFYTYAHVARRHGIFKGGSGENKFRPLDSLSTSELAVLRGRLPPGGPLPPEEQTNGLTPILDPDAARTIAIDVPFYSQRLGGPDFVAGDYQCFFASKSMVEHTEGEDGALHVEGPSNRFQMAIAQNAGGEVTVDPAQAEAAIQYLDQQLEGGHPVVVGVNYADTSYDHENADGLTDHFVVINGRSGVGPGATYTFLDPWAMTAEGARGTFTLDSDFKLVYRADEKGEKLSTHYDVTMVRVNTLT